MSRRVRVTGHVTNPGNSDPADGWCLRTEEPYSGDDDPRLVALRAEEQRGGPVELSHPPARGVELLAGEDAEGFVIDLARIDPSVRYLLVQY